MVKYTADMIFRKLPIPLRRLPGCSHFSPVQENIAAAVDGNIFAQQMPGLRAVMDAVSGEPG